MEAAVCPALPLIGQAAHPCSVATPGSLTAWRVLFLLLWGGQGEREMLRPGVAVNCNQLG